MSQYPFTEYMKTASSPSLETLGLVRHSHQQALRDARRLFNQPGNLPLSAYSANLDAIDRKRKLLELSARDFNQARSQLPVELQSRILPVTGL